MTTRWNAAEVPRGDDYDVRWQQMAAAGENVHGEADLVEQLLREHRGHAVLDAGCGTGRVAIELARRELHVVGVDADEQMLAAARRNGPGIDWIHADLAALDTSLDESFDLIVLAGNVMIFVRPGTEGTVLAQLSERLRPGGLLVAGFQLRSGGFGVAEYDSLSEALALGPVARWSTWDQAPFTEESDYAVSVHRRVG